MTFRKGGTVRTGRRRSGDRRRRVAYHHGDLRRALVEATAELVVERGADAVTLREVGRRAGVSHTAPYHHFADKDTLMAAVAEEGFRRFDAAQAGAIDGLPPGTAPLDRFRALGRSYIEFARQQPNFLDVMFRSGDVDASRHPGLAEVAGRTFQRLLDVVAGVVGADDPRDPRVQAGAVFAWSAVHGFSMLWLHGRLADDESELDGLVTALLDRVGRGLQGGLPPRP